MALLGLATLLMAGVIALVQTDIKRIIAYSTMSQIGYMFTAVGVGAYSAGMFLLLAHAFFKALLFLGAGIVIHALDGEQDVRRMGGLGSALPKTKWMMWIGTVALIGFWPFSKDDVLAAALQKGGATADIVWVGGLVGAFFTGIYATRLMRLTFYGERSQFASEHLHSGHGEAPWVMFWTVGLLAVGTLLVGFLEIGYGISNAFFDWLASTAPTIEPSDARDLATTASRVGGGRRRRPADLARLQRPRAARPAQASVGRDGRRSPSTSSTGTRLYDRIAYIPAAAIATAVYRFFERWVIWGTIDLVAYIVRLVARGTADAQTGVVRQYATVLVAGGGRARRVLPLEGDAVTTALIFLPLAGALVVGLLPLSRRLTEWLALAVALAEAVLGAIALIGFDTGGGIQYVQNTGWISDFGAGAPIRYHVGMGGLSLFMVLL